MIKKIIHKFLNIHPNAMSFKESLDLAEMPVVTFYQGDKKINFLLDTGSNNCIIDSSFLKKIEHTMLEGSSNIQGLEGNPQEAQICSIEITYKNNTYEYPYVIQDMSAVFNSIKRETGVTVNGILGSAFFNKYNYILDFNELIAYRKE